MVTIRFAYGLGDKVRDISDKHRKGEVIAMEYCHKGNVVIFKDRSTGQTHRDLEKNVEAMK
ncbi:hypothetical protein CPT_Silvanus_028 [Stenotrophomonas phage Silvanus]|nr:hypothetical protein CPT_Silvanus_028 [Stenotrophomonas phage Silvanus]